MTALARKRRGAEAGKQPGHHRFLHSRFANVPAGNERALRLCMPSIITPRFAFPTSPEFMQKQLQPIIHIIYAARSLAMETIEQLPESETAPIGFMVPIALRDIDNRCD
ncbi:hypothetical protein VTP01DRAFT_8614 [Rhizomucor pusillus]|uniref:uncharacterized protein n=1 Tax=Rhizomucor pusillus TaxID=4840 RepID=UPI003741FAC6